MVPDTIFPSSNYSNTGKTNSPDAAQQLIALIGNAQVDTNSPAPKRPSFLEKLQSVARTATPKNRTRDVATVDSTKSKTNAAVDIRKSTSTVNSPTTDNSSSATDKHDTSATDQTDQQASDDNATTAQATDVQNRSVQTDEIVKPVQEVVTVEVVAEEVLGDEAVTEAVISASSSKIPVGLAQLFSQASPVVPEVATTPQSIVDDETTAAPAGLIQGLVAQNQLAIPTQTQPSATDVVVEPEVVVAEDVASPLVVEQQAAIDSDFDANTGAEIQTAPTQLTTPVETVDDINLDTTAETSTIIPTEESGATAPLAQAVAVKAPEAVVDPTLETKPVEAEQSTDVVAAQAPTVTTQTNTATATTVNEQTDDVTTQTVVQNEADKQAESKAEQHEVIAESSEAQDQTPVETIALAAVAQPVVKTSTSTNSEATTTDELSTKHDDAVDAKDDADHGSMAIVNPLATGLGTQIVAPIQPAAVTSTTTDAVDVATVQVGVSENALPELTNDGTDSTLVDELSAEAGQSFGNSLSNAVGETAASNSFDDSISPTAQKIVHQLTNALGSIDEGSKSIKIRLNPPELGMVQIDITKVNGVVTAKISAESAQTHQLLQDHLAHLKHTLESQGQTVQMLQVEHAPDMSKDSQQEQQRDQQNQKREEQGSQQQNQNSQQQAGQEQRSRQQQRQSTEQNDDETNVELNDKPASTTSSSITELDLQI
jgi:flagellar hook-length control protein FliK